MRLINKDNKIYLYDELKDKYKLIQPDDLEHILDDNNKLYPDETIRIYFKFKEGKYKTNKKGYISKKANIKQEYKAALDQTQKDYIVSRFLNDISGLRDIDRMAFVKSPTIQTIKKFSVDEETKKKLINKFNDISKNYITIKDDGDDINDMFNYFISNNINISLSQAAREVIKSILKDFRDGKLTVEQVKDKLTLNKSKFYDPQKPDNYERFMKRIEMLLNVSQDDLKSATKKTEIDKELEKVNEIVDEAIPDNKVLVLDKSEFEDDEAFEQAKTLNNNNMFVPSEIFKSSKIKKYNNSYFGTNAAAYRILKYLSNNKDLKYNEINRNEDGDYYITTLKTEFGDITIPIDKNQYLYEPLKDIIDEIEIKDKKINFNVSDNIFNTEGNTLNKLTEKSTSKENKNISKNISEKPDYNIFEFDLKNEETQNILKDLKDDITTNEFVHFIDDYYEKYNKDDYIHPDKEFRGKDKYINDYYTDKLFGSLKYNQDGEEAAATYTYFERLFKVLPKNLIGKIPPHDLRDIIKEFTDIYKLTVNGIKLNNDKVEKLNNEIEELKTKLLSEKDIKQLNKDLTNEEKNGVEREEIQNKLNQNEEIIKSIQEKTDLITALNNETLGSLEEINGKIEDGKLKYDYKFITDEIKDKYDLTEEEAKKYNNIIKNYVDKEVLNNLYYMTAPSKLNTLPNQPINKYDTTQDIYNYAKLNKWNKQRFYDFEEDLKGFGGSWSFNVLNKIDELNNMLKNNSFGGSWSFNVLDKIDKLNSLLNKSSGSWSYDVLNKINELNDLI